MHEMTDFFAAVPCSMCCWPTLQKDALQTGIPLQLSGKLASHTVEEFQKYAANNTYEMHDVTGRPLVLVRFLSGSVLNSKPAVCWSKTTAASTAAQHSLNTRLVTKLLILCAPPAVAGCIPGVHRVDYQGPSTSAAVQLQLAVRHPS